MSDRTLRGRKGSHSQPHQIALQVFEILAGMQGMTRQEFLKHTLDVVILQSAAELKQMLQIQLEGLEQLESGQSLKAIDDAFRRAFGESWLTEERQVSISIGRGTEHYLQAISQATGQNREELLEEALSQIIRTRADVLQANFREYLDYIQQLESGKGLLNEDFSEP